jgi:hypothetical protein
MKSSNQGHHGAFLIKPDKIHKRRLPVCDAASIQLAGSGGLEKSIINLNELLQSFDIISNTSIKQRKLLLLLAFLYFVIYGPEFIKEIISVYHSNNVIELNFLLCNIQISF